MAYECTVAADSIDQRGNRLTTMVVTLPRIVLAEFNTHREFSRNSASSRAIPTRKQLSDLVTDAFTPTEFGTAIGGMNAGPILEGERLEEALELWQDAAQSQMWHALCLTTSTAYVDREWRKWMDEESDEFSDFLLDVARRIEDKSHSIHQEPLLWATKGLTNRLLEPFMWHKLIVTFTEVENFLNLRTDENAQLEIRTAANLMKVAYEASTPVNLVHGQWHLPFIQPDEQEWAQANPELAIKATTARSARVSYLTHDKKVVDLNADFRLADSLAKNGHMSPFEHAATPFSDAEWHSRNAAVRALYENGYGVEKHVLDLIADRLQFSGNFRGWAQARRDIPNQQVFQPAQSS